MKRTRETTFDDLYDELLGDCPRDELTYNNANDVLKWINLYGRPWTEKTCANAALNAMLVTKKYIIYEAFHK